MSPLQADQGSLRWVILAGVMLALLPSWVSSAIALLAGVLVAPLLAGNPVAAKARAWVRNGLSLAIIGLGAGMDLRAVARAGAQGFGYTIVSIAFTLLVGLYLGRRLKVTPDVSLLLSAGTAICGGSAIAAVASVIRPRSDDITVSLGVVFLLNAIALLIFPPLGHWSGLTETQFGLWSALAIHDTSSVIGATVGYGARALEVGTTVKLVRALWIAPVAIGIGWYRYRREAQSSGKRSFRKPWFIAGFVLMAAIFTWAPQWGLQGLAELGPWISLASKRLFVLCLFWIGTGMDWASMKRFGVRPVLLGVGLWAIIGSGTLLLIKGGLLAE